MSPLDQWDLAPGEAISQSPPDRAGECSRDLACPLPSLDTEQFNIDAAASLSDSPSLSSLYEFDLARGEILSQSPPDGIWRCPLPPCPPPTLDTQEFNIDAAASLSDSQSLSSLYEFDLAQGEILSQPPPGGIWRCPLPPCPPPTLDTQEFMNDRLESEDAWEEEDSEGGCEDVPDYLDGATCESTEETTTSTVLPHSRLNLSTFQSRVHPTLPVLSPARKPILSESSPTNSRQDPAVVDKVELPSTDCKTFEAVHSHGESNEGTRKSQLKEISVSESFDVPSNSHPITHLPSVPLESSAVSHNGQDLCGLSSTRGCGNVERPEKRKKDEESPCENRSERQRKVLVQLSPNVSGDSSAPRDANGGSGHGSNKENSLVAKRSAAVGLIRPAAAKQELVPNVRTGSESEDVTKRSTPSKSCGSEPKVKILSSLGAYSAAAVNAGRDSNLSYKVSEWRNPRDGKKFVNAAKQLSLDRWLG